MSAQTDPSCPGLGVSSMPAPNTLLVGAAKCGTTTLYHFFAQHPECCVSKLKEPRYFIAHKPSDDLDGKPVLNNVESWDEYLSLFPDPASVVIDCSPQYLYRHVDAIPRIHERLGENVHILIILRNPINRALSVYNHLKRRARIPADETFDRMLDLEPKRLAAGATTVNAVDSGRYADQVAAYQTVFPKVDVLLYEDMVADPGAFRDDLCRRLGIAPTGEIGHHNPENASRSRVVASLLRRRPVFVMLGRLLRRLGLGKAARKVRMKVRNANLEPQSSSLDPALRARLQASFRDDIARLESLIGRDLSHWT